MSTQSQVWVWRSALDDKQVHFQHPSEIPASDESLSKTRFVEQLRGPRLARISPATLLQTTPNMALIAESGATREVNKPLVMPWYEGLLLLEALEALQTQGDNKNTFWCDNELRSVLDQERSKFKGGQISSALYTEKRLLNVAITGPKFVDSEDREFAYRRENVRADDKNCMLEGENGGGFFRVRDIIGYLPPWEAFCHEKCGFWQDFYLVRWEYPFSEVDYSKVENGCTGVVGATWEPDECLPTHLDPLRLSAKRAWIKKRREMELKLAEQKMKGAGPKPAVKRPSPEPTQTVAVKKEEQPEVKRARLRRDGAPLERDCFHCKIGHDFATDEKMEQSFPGIRAGWPKLARDYPKGYGVADPPGFCWEGCDCMDDQRPQRTWETSKAWLEDPMRTAAANAAIEALSAQTRFVRRRGQVSKMCFFETPQTILPNQKTASAALDLAKAITKAVAGVLNKIPLHSLVDQGEAPVRIPARLVLSDELDYEPLQFRLAALNGGELPTWLHINEDTGELQVAEVPAMVQPLALRVEFLHAEGNVGVATCGITPDRLEGLTAPWTELTIPIVQRFSDASLCPLETRIREGLQLHFAEVYDFKQQRVRERSVGEWVDIMTLLLRMLRTATCANVALATSHRAALQQSIPGRNP